MFCPSHLVITDTDGDDRHWRGDRYFNNGGLGRLVSSGALGNMVGQ